MRKILLVSILMFSSIIPVSAGFVSEEQRNVISVENIMRMKDKSFVTMEGYIVKQIGKEKYLFKDNSGEIVVELDDKLLYNITVTPKTKVKISGEVERDLWKTELEAAKIEIIK